MKIDTQQVIDIVKSTRDISLPRFGNIEIKEFKSEYAYDAVTEIDQQIETHLQTELAALAPEVTFVGEEFGGDRTSERFWLVDPIDATGHYIRGVPFCTTMLALIDNKRAIFSIIYDFVNDVVFHAELGGGAYANGDPIAVSDRPLRGAYVSLETDSRKETNRQLLIEVRKRANFINTVSAGFEFALVASGKLEARMVYDGFGKDFDFAPGTLLVSEAGGVVKNFGSDDYDYTNCNFIAANPKVFDALINSEDSIEKLLR